MVGRLKPRTEPVRGGGLTALETARRRGSEAKVHRVGWGWGVGEGEDEGREGQKLWYIVVLASY